MSSPLAKIGSKYSVYATNVLGFDYNSTLIIAQAAAIISYIPVGIVSSKIGRRKTILAGIVMLGTAFLLLLLQQEHGEHFREIGQHLDLFFGPEPLGYTFVEADVSPEYAIVPDGTVEHGFDALGCHNIVDVLGQFPDIRAVEDAFLVEIGIVIGNIRFVADIL